MATPRSQAGLTWVLVHNATRWIESPYVAVPLLSCATLLLYFPSFGSGFLTDDFILLADLTNRGIPWFSSWLAHSGYFRPVVSASLTLHLFLFGSDAVSFHVANLAFHLIVVIGLFGATKKIIRVLGVERGTHAYGWVPFLAALAFCLHPANVVDVSWISGRTDLLAGVGLIAAVLGYLNERGSSEGRIGWKTVAASAFALGAKEIGVVVLPLIVLLEIGLRVSSRIPVLPRALVRQHAPLAVLMAVYFSVRHISLEASPSTLAWNHINVLDVAALLAKIPVLVAIPTDLLSAASLFRAQPLIVKAAFVAVSAAGALVLLLLLRPRSRTEWYLASIPFSGMILFSLPHVVSGIVTQRLMYVPLLGCFLVMTPWIVAVVGPDDAAMGRVASQTRHWTMAALFAVLIVVWGAGAIDLAAEWPRVGAAERDAVHSLTSQITDSVQPIVVAVYPHRVRQTGMFWAFDYRLHHAMVGRFGKLSNVWTGIGVISRDVDSIGSNVRIDPPNLTSELFSIRTEGDDYLMLDQSQIAAADGIVVVERPGYRSRNRLLEGESIRLNGLSRTIEYHCRILDTTVWRTGAVFVWENGAFKRLR